LLPGLRQLGANDLDVLRPTEQNPAEQALKIRIVSRGGLLNSHSKAIKNPYSYFSKIAATAHPACFSSCFLQSVRVCRI
jgi:hypothetical protein